MFGFVRTGKWTTIAELEPGTIFETEDGVVAVKSEYGGYSDDVASMCVLVASGEYAHFKNGNNERAREIILPVKLRKWEPTR